jgi:hypothetical protein
MRYGTKAVLTVLAVLILAGGAYAIHKIYPAESTPPLPGANAEKLNEYIVYQNPYRSWDLWPGKGKALQGRGHHRQGKLHEEEEIRCPHSHVQDKGLQSQGR